jgi:hypothetical protein
VQLQLVLVVVVVDFIYFRQILVWQCNMKRLQKIVAPGSMQLQMLVP